MELDEASAMSEITILPDGRVFAFGTTRPVLEVLESLEFRDARLRRLLQHLARIQALSSAEETPR